MEKEKRKRPDPLPPEVWDKIQWIWETSGNITMCAEKYGVNRRSIYRMAKLKGWKRKGHLSDTARTTAGERFIEDTASEYERQARESFDRGLTSFRRLHDSATMALKEIDDSLRVKIAFNDKVRAINHVRIEEAKRTSKIPRLISTISTIAETKQLAAVGNTLHRAIIEGERVILNITDFNPYRTREEDDNPINRLIEVFNNGVAELNELVAQGKIDPHTGDWTDGVNPQP